MHGRKSAMIAAGILGGAATAARSLLPRRIIPARLNASAIVDEMILRDERSRDNRGSANSAAGFEGPLHIDRLV
jgi:hypothetical protein